MNIQNHHVNLEPQHLRRLQVELESIIEIDFGVVMAAFATVDGFQVAMKERYTSKGSGRIAAMTSSLSALGTAVTNELTIGNLECVLVEANAGRLIMTQVPFGANTVILSVVTNRDVLLGKVLAACRETAARLVRDLRPAKQL